MRSRSFPTTVAIVAAILSAPAVAQVSEVWVDDDWLNCVPGTPVDGRTCGVDGFDAIQDGIDAVDPNGIVRVAAGTYAENLIVIKDGLIVAGAGPGLTVIDGGFNGSVVRVQGPSVELTMHGFMIMGGTGDWIGSYTYGGGFLVLDATLTLRDTFLVANSSSDGAGGIEARDSEVYLYDIRILDNVGWWGGGITFRNTQGEIWRNVIEANGCGYGGSVWLTDSSTVLIQNSRITRNTCYPPAIGIGGSTSVTIVNNTIADNNGPGVATGVYDTGGETGTATIYNNIIWGNPQTLVNVTATYSDTDGADVGEGNISGNPDFVNAAAGNYDLEIYSPAIDAGTNDGAPATDLYDLLRPIDGDGDGVATVDMGAHEVRGPFNDVPPQHWAVTFIERLAISGITSGCGNDNFCPEQPVTRAQMAVFLERGMHGASYSPPAAAGVFGDVAPSHWAAPWIEQLAAEGITSGCGGGNYCPDDSVTRDQMAVFLVRAFGL